jgi:hypothetical protein
VTGAVGYLPAGIDRSCMCLGASSGSCTLHDMGSIVFLVARTVALKSPP